RIRRDRTNAGRAAPHAADRRARTERCRDTRLLPRQNQGADARVDASEVLQVDDGEGRFQEDVRENGEPDFGRCREGSESGSIEPAVGATRTCCGLTTRTTCNTKRRCNQRLFLFCTISPTFHLPSCS